MKTKLLFLIIAITMTSCSGEFLQKYHCKRCLITTTTITTVHTTDTIIITETLKDTTIIVYLPADSVITVLKVECDSMGLAQMKEIVIRSNRILARLKIENGVLTQNISTIMDSLEVVIQTKERTIQRLKEKISDTQSQVVKPEYKIPKWVKGLAWLGGAVLVLVIGLFLLKRFI